MAIGPLAPSHRTRAPDFHPAVGNERGEAHADHQRRRGRVPGAGLGHKIMRLVYFGHVPKQV